MDKWIVRASFYGANDFLICIREQEVSKEDTLQNCLRRFSSDTTRRLERNDYTKRVTIEIKRG